MSDSGGRLTANGGRIAPPHPEAALPDHERAESQGRTALVTGGGRGIGRAIALALAAESHAVAVADIGEEEAAETASMIASGQGRAHAVRLDVTDRDSVR